MGSASLRNEKTTGYECLNTTMNTTNTEKTSENRNFSNYYFWSAKKVKSGHFSRFSQKMASGADFGPGGPKFGPGGHFWGAPI